MDPRRDAPPKSQKIQGPLPDGALVDNKYQLTRLLGAGAMGAVYEAEHTGTGRRVALKVIMGQFAKDEGLVARFHREARAAGAIETQHITQVLDTGYDRDAELPFMVMEYLEGEDVQHLLKRAGPISPDLALRIVAQACLGLQKAHDKHVVHRDIKPANLFLAKRDAGEVIIKLLDFGIAKVKMEQAQETESAGLTKTGNMLGSPLYMSPEQARGARSIDHRTDIWSLGVVLYQALCGKTPFQHLTALGELIISICSTHAQPVQERAPWVPPEVAAIAHKAMRHDPAQRYQSAMEMFQDIRALLPNGWNINDDMLVPMSQTARDQQAPKMALSMPPPPPMATITGPDQGVGMSSSPGLSGSGPGLSGSGSQAGATNVAMTTASGTQASGGKKGLIFGLAAVIVVAASGIGYMLLKAPPVAATTPPPPPPTQEPILVVSVTASAAAQPPALAPADVTPKRFKLVIEPKDAKVEIDGQVVKPDSKGVVDIRGALGALIPVKISKGKQEYQTDVAITESGPIPPKLELLPPGAPRPSGAPSAGGTAAPKPTSTATRTSFE
ncbi:MAG: serine/threonine protein kinase [Polyangiaceae bacterium]|nr:serine/threonine protein kinase [Polyangiaceae bacterium]